MGGGETKPLAPWNGAEHACHAHVCLPFPPPPKKNRKTRPNFFLAEHTSRSSLFSFFFFIPPPLDPCGTAHKCSTVQSTCPFRSTFIQFSNSKDFSAVCPPFLVCKFPSVVNFSKIDCTYTLQQNGSFVVLCRLFLLLPILIGERARERERETP